MNHVWKKIQTRHVLRGYPTQYIIFLHLMFNQNKCWSNNIYRQKTWNFDVFFYLKVTVAMETAAILEIWRNYDFSFFWLTKRAIFKIPNQSYYFYIILWSDRRKLLFKSHKVHFGRIFDHKISIFGKKSVFGSKKYLLFIFFQISFCHFIHKSILSTQAKYKLNGTFHGFKILKMDTTVCKNLLLRNWHLKFRNTKICK